MWRMLFGRGAWGEAKGPTAGASSAGGAGGASATGELSPPEAQHHLQRDSVLLDVREPEEWAGGHAPGAVHIPLGQLASRLHELPRDKEVITVCRSGGRSTQAAKLLRQAGFPHVANLKGGMTAWGKDGLPVTR